MCKFSKRNQTRTKSQHPTRMGLKINDTITLDSGVALDGMYASFGLSPLVTYVELDQNGNKNYTAAGTVSFYKDADAYAAGLTSVVDQRVTLELDADSVQAVYYLFYTALAARYQSTEKVQPDPDQTQPASQADNTQPASQTDNTQASSS